MPNRRPPQDPNTPKSAKARRPLPDGDARANEEGRQPADGPAKDSAPQQSRESMRTKH
jgi:hypothetical protein